MNEGKEKTTFDVYYAFDDEYEEVLYLKSYDSEAEDEKTQINVVVKKDNSSFDALYAQYLSEVGSTAAGFATYSDPSTIAAQFDENDPNYDVSVSYYSGINGDFSVKGVAKITNEAAEAVGEDSEYMTPKTTTVIATYSKDVFASYSSEIVMLNGDKASGSGSISYQKSFLKISLPSGWQNELDKEAE